MTIKQTQRKRIFKSGLGMLLLGATLGVTGYVSAPASAADNDHQITICHQEGNGGYTSPNPTKPQVLDEENGHKLHLGDIIPPFVAGSQGNNSWAAFDGLNWDDAGQAIWNNGCRLPDEPIVPVDVCPEVDGTQASASDCPVVVPEVIAEVVSQSPAVEGAQLAAAPAAPAAPELPRTGRGSLPLAEFGLGLVLMGAGALLFGREQTATV